MINQCGTPIIKKNKNKNFYNSIRKRQPILKMHKRLRHFTEEKIQMNKTK